jgi:hypothetical protein
MELIKDNVVKITDDTVKIRKLKEQGFKERTASSKQEKEPESTKEVKKK